MADLIRPRRRAVVLLGATGSIGLQVCDVVARYPEHFQLVAVAANHGAEELQAIASRFGVKRTALAGETGEDAICELAQVPADVVCIAIPGAAALRPTLAAVDAGSLIATATKEVLVMAGEFVLHRAQAKGTRILPIDSEHSAIWQCLRGESSKSVSRLVLTGSGGPFRLRPLSSFSGITVDEALQHPTWKMGQKITIDSATMMNKALEMIEAHHLFGVPYSQIDVMIHPTSIVHSYVEFVDGVTKAQLGLPDMRAPIALALADGERLPGVTNPVELESGADLHFESVDHARYPAIALGRRAGEAAGTAPAVMNAANEAAVGLFLNGKLRFDEIVETVTGCVDQILLPKAADLDAVIAADREAREWVRSRTQEYSPPR